MTLSFLIHLDELANDSLQVSDMATGLPFWELSDDVIQKSM